MTGPLYGFSVYPDAWVTAGREEKAVGLACERCQWNHPFPALSEVGLAELNTIATDHRKECP